VEVPAKFQVFGKYESNDARNFPAPWLDSDDLVVDHLLVMQILGKQGQRLRIDNQQTAHAPAALLRLDLTPTMHRLDTMRLKNTAERFINLTRPRNYSIRQPAQFLTRACSTAVVEQRIME
jgi:hypothetical protein